MKVTKRVTIEDVAELCQRISENIPNEYLEQIQDYYFTLPESGPGYTYLMARGHGLEQVVALHTNYGDFRLNDPEHVAICKIEETLLIQHIKDWVRLRVFPVVQMGKTDLDRCVHVLSAINARNKKKPQSKVEKITENPNDLWNMGRII